VPVKSTVEIFQNFVPFSEHMNFKQQNFLTESSHTARSVIFWKLWFGNSNWQSTSFGAKLDKNKLEKDFDLQVRYLYFKINFNFSCTAKFLKILDNSRIYFIYTAKFLKYSDNGEL
jgi:hypothetical protein